MDDLLEMDAGALVTAMATGEVTAEALMEATLDRIAVVNGTVNAVVSLRDADVLLAEARAADQAADRGAFHGLPVAVKDLAHVAGIVTSEGSPAFADRVAVADDLHVARMRAAGAIFIGKTNAPEFGLGSHTFNPVFGATRNPYDRAVTCGGSSGGAAVALATRMTAIADGSDMMGSLRNPAGWNNVYGFRPTWGRVPAEPAGDGYLHQISTNGPMARSPADIALLLNVMAGPDGRQPLGLKADHFSAEDAEIRGKRIGWLRDWGGAWAMEAGILDLCETALGVFAEAGCEVEAIPVPFSRDALWESWTVLRSWAVSVGLAPLMARPDTRAQLKDTAIWEAERGMALSAAGVQAASEIRTEWFRAAAALFDRYDALAAPTAQVWPFAIDTAYPTEIAGQGMDTYHRWMEVMIPASLVGLPALAVPAGFGAHGLPMGMQIIGRHGDDQGVLTLGQAYHRRTLWPQKRPPEI
ncbi:MULTISPECIES: amidase [unclassified Roseovarius]|uniref:amidase n=1 Tax=unclassified Roseovarius TaxID=2614913 RepID=UPI00273D474D|nr:MULTISPECIES: amidase [unclassified Roseovarius]